MHLMNRGYVSGIPDSPSTRRHTVLPHDLAEGLFKALFARAAGLSNAGTKQGEENILKDLDRQAQQAAFLAGDFVLPSGSVKKLAALLEGRGMDARSAAGILAGAKDQEGRVKLASLLSGLQDASQEEGKAKDGVCADAGQIPQIASFLMRYGLGVGQVKGLMEKALSADGSLDIQRLEKGLSNQFPGLSLDGRLPGLLSDFGIRWEARAIALDGERPELGKALQGPVTSSSNELPQRVRGILAGLLREKGIPPEEVKSFLEGVTLEDARSMLKPRVLIHQETAERELAALVDRGKMAGGEDRWDAQAPRKRAIELLREDRSDATRSSSGKDLFARTGGREGPSEAGTVSPEAGIGNRGPVRPENRIGPELVPERRGEVRPTEGETSSVRATAGQTPDGPSGVTLQAEGAGARSAPESGILGPYRETLVALGDKMSWMIQASIQKARIRLSPPELGRVDVQLTVERGHVSAQLCAESVMAKEMIDANLSHLKQHLSDLGFVVERFEVLVGLTDQRAEERDGLWSSWDERKSSQGRKERAKTGAPTAAETLRAVQESGYQVSLRV